MVMGLALLPPEGVVRLAQGTGKSAPAKELLILL